MPMNGGLPAVAWLDRLGCCWWEATVPRHCRPASRRKSTHACDARGRKLRKHQPGRGTHGCHRQAIRESSGIWLSRASGDDAEIKVPLSLAGAALRILDAEGSLTYSAFKADGVPAVYRPPRGASKPLLIADRTIFPGPASS